MNRLKNTKVLIGIIIALVVINIATISFFWLVRPMPFEKNHGDQSDHRVEHFLQKRLDLTKDQSRSFREERHNHFMATKDLVKGIRKDRKRLMKLLAQDPNSAEVEQLISKISSTQLELEWASFKHMQKLRGFCNEAQRPKFDSLVYKIVDRLGHSRERMKKRHRKRH